jgi:NAD+ kinase
MRFGLVANLKRAGSRDAIHAIVNWAERVGQELSVCDELKPVMGEGLNFVRREEIAERVDILVSMGGDGTLLATARSVGTIGTPILGINLGSLGFLTQLTPQQLIPALEMIVAGEYEVGERMVLKAEVEDHGEFETPYALNDVVLDNGPVARMLDIHLTANGEDVVTYKADGLIISTPTGSTAYNLAVGGPIMHPRLDAMIASPISAFSLTTRPMIFPPDDVLELVVLTEGREAILTLDGQVMISLRHSQKVKISRAGFRSKFVTFPDSSYYKLLKSKLHWGMTPDYLDHP